MWCTFEDDGDWREHTPAEGGPGDVVAFARERLGFEPEERQAEVLRCEAKRLILNCSRQWGKSTLAAVKAVHRALERPGCLVMVASRTARQSAELVMKVRGLLGRAGIRGRGDGSNRISVTLPNGSRIVGLPGNEETVRGYSAVSLLLIDEASRVADELYRGLRPMLAVADGDLWLMSTPWSKQGFFYEAWAYGGEEWVRFASPVTECPRVKPSFLEEERRELGEQWFRQEYLCEFVDAGGTLFGRDLVEAALTDLGGWPPERAGWIWPVVKGTLFIGLDLGKMQDFSAMAIVEREEQRIAWMPSAYRNLQIRHLERLPLGTPYTLVVERVKAICEQAAELGQCDLVVDATGVGGAVVEMLRSARLGVGMLEVTLTGGEREAGGGVRKWVPKRDLLSVLQVTLEQGELKVDRRLKESGALVRELLRVRPDGSQSEHDDLVIAAGLACWAARRSEVGPQGTRLPGI